jgi:pimeloyl-ACP methyl ester carboxylesterase
VVRNAALLLAFGLLAACGSQHPTAHDAPTSASPALSGGRADVGGYELAWRCEGTGEPTVILEAGLGGSGADAFHDIFDDVAEISRVCTYDRAGTGVSDDRPMGTHVTAGLMAEELHALLDEIGVERPVVLLGHSYGGMPVRAFEGEYPDEVAGMILLDVSSEPEVPVYERLGVGDWIDDTDRIDMETTMRQLRAAGDLGDIPLVVVTAGRIDDEYLATVPRLASRAQTRLAGLSTNAIHVVATDSGHFVYEDEPDVVLAAIRVVVDAADDGRPLPACDQVFAHLGTACVAPGSVPTLEVDTG